MSEQPVTCLPPPLPPKTKAQRSGGGNLEESDKDRWYLGHQESKGDGILISASYPAHQDKRSSATATVNLNTVDFSIPDGFQELTYSCKNSGKGHIVKIFINPDDTRFICDGENGDDRGTSEKLSGGEVPQAETCIRISVNNSSESYQGNKTMFEAVGRSSPSQYYFNQFTEVMSSGQISPNDTLDSGTCSDLDGTPSSFIEKKKNGNGVSVTLIESFKNSSNVSSGAEVDSDDNDSNSGASNISCDSLNNGKSFPVRNGEFKLSKSSESSLPLTLLREIRQRKGPELVDEKAYEDRQKENLQIEEDRRNFHSEVFSQPSDLNSDMFFNFHLNEKDINKEPSLNTLIEEETFAGYKDLLGCDNNTIRSAKGTVRGVRNRVRAGIATFLQINSTEMSYKEKDAGKVVVYTTSMGIIRETYQACMKVKQILRTLLVQFEERDVFMSTEYQSEIRERMRCEQILVPQVYVDGQHCGDAETIERLNESGELRKILKPYKNPDCCITCEFCGGYRVLPCGVCNGSKKSVHRNHFTAEFVALKCMNCDDNGLVKCSACSI
ncbi:glutaredoxin domain-containing cysteine-rich protein CG31559-like [Euwallacea similis]|uniref:glutaredoxin domain-containing cysteine-rich protein CG31559-like n=1 Tax=Euwallacea similis TaxID=1736056 RepID=UPI00344D03A6